jgi:hypothetical protein
MQSKPGALEPYEMQIDHSILEKISPKQRTIHQWTKTTADWVQAGLLAYFRLLSPFSSLKLIIHELKSQNNIGITLLD